MSENSFRGRIKARKYALQGLYSWTLSSTDLVEIEEHLLSTRNPKKFDLDYFKKLLHDIPRNITTIDERLSSYIDRSINDLDPIELNVLRLAVYELLYSKDIPYKVVINEAIELVKEFGAKESHLYINGVLDKVAKNLDP